MDHRVLRQVEAGDGVGAHLVEEVVAQAEQRPVPGGRDLHVVHLVALHARHQGVLAPRLDPLHRPAELAGQLRDHDVLGVVHALGAEASADVGRRDHAHVVLGQAELLRDHPAVAVDHLHRAPHREPRVLPLGDQRARLERVRPAAGEADARAHPHRRVAQRLVHVAHPLPPLRHHVAADLLVEDRRAGGQRRLHVHHRGQRLVLHADEVERVPGAVDVLRDHHRHRLAHETHALAASGMILHGTGSAGCGA